MKAKVFSSGGQSRQASPEEARRMEGFFIKAAPVRRGWSRQRFATIPEMLRAYGIADMTDEAFASRFPWITHDPAEAIQYRVSRRSTHDGTLCFTHEAICNAVNALVKRETYFIPDGECERITQVRYIVTGISIARVFGQVDLPCGRRPGLREAIRIGVRYLKDGESL